MEVRREKSASKGRKLGWKIGMYWKEEERERGSEIEIRHERAEESFIGIRKVSLVDPD